MKKPNKKTLKAMQDVENGKTEVISFYDFLKEIDPNIDDNLHIKGLADHMEKKQIKYLKI